MGPHEDDKTKPTPLAEPGSVSPTPKEAWCSPQITDLDLAQLTQGISYTPGDGSSNLTP